LFDVVFHNIDRIEAGSEGALVGVPRRRFRGGVDSSGYSAIQTAPIAISQSFAKSGRVFGQDQGEQDWALLPIEKVIGILTV
jgi:hypothetical protein